MRTLALVLLTGCLSSGSSEYADLYEAPMGAATASIHGTWGGAAEGIDTRWVLATNRITLAAKCGSKIVGVDVAGEVSATQIRFLESAQSGNESCFVRTIPATFTACSTDPFDPKEMCFVFTPAQKSLTIHFDALDEITLTKLTDATP